MTEEEKKKLLEEGKSEVEIMQLEEIADMKEKMDQMVDPEKFAELEKQYKILLKKFTDRRPAPKPDEEKPIRKTSEVAKEIYSIQNGNISNRAYIEKALEYRKSHIAEFGTDPFTDFGQHGPQKPTEDTERVATVLQTLLDENPSDVDFRIKLNSVLKDDPQLMAKLRKGRK